MQINIENFAKIAKAEIELDGITVIGGENNTGKSTVGKILYSIFHSLQNIEGKVRADRINTVIKIIRRYDVLSRANYAVIRKGQANDFVLELMDCVCKIKNKKCDLVNRIYRFIVKELQEDDSFPDSDGLIAVDSSDFELFVEQLAIAVELSNEEICDTLIKRCFEAEFTGQINHINANEKKEDVAKVHVKLDDGAALDVTVKDNNVRIDRENIRITTPTVYLDDPFILNRLDRGVNASEYEGEIKDHSANVIAALQRSQLANSVTEETMIKKKLVRVFERLELAVSGEYISEKKAKGFVEKGFNKPLHFSNLSTGIKTFLIFEILLLNGEICEGSLLILDEPEVHLHPAWQLVFAEIIVLLQVELNLKVFMTTHSPYFLRAIEVYSAKHEVADRCKFYMADFEDNEVILEDVTTNTDAIYRKLAEPFKKLDEIQYGEE